MKDDANNSLPLAPAALHILLSLAAEDLHGYGIMQVTTGCEITRIAVGFLIVPILGCAKRNQQKTKQQRFVQSIEPNR